MKKSLKNIIFFEDDPLDCEIFSELVSQIDGGINCHFLANAKDLSLLKKVNTKESLISLDLNLCEIDGFTVYSNCLRDSDFIVYVHTSSDNPNDIKTAQELGLKYYFQKKTLHADIKKQLELFINLFQNNLTT